MDAGNKAAEAHDDGFTGLRVSTRRRSTARAVALCADANLSGQRARACRRSTETSCLRVEGRVGLAVEAHVDEHDCRCRGAVAAATNFAKAASFDALTGAAALS